MKLQKLWLTDFRSYESAELALAPGLTAILSGLPAGFNPLTSITNVRFYYGTNVSEGDFVAAVPEPATLARAGSAVLPLGLTASPAPRRRLTHSAGALYTARGHGGSGR